MFPLESMTKVLDFAKGKVPTTLEEWLDLVDATTELIRFGSRQLLEKPIGQLSSMSEPQAISLMEAAVAGQVAHPTFTWQPFMPVLLDIEQQLHKRQRRGQLGPQPPDSKKLAQEAAKAAEAK